MPNKKISCKTGLKKYAISRSVFEKEIEICKRDSKKIKADVIGGNAKIAEFYPFYRNYIKTS